MGMEYTDVALVFRTHRRSSSVGQLIGFVEAQTRNTCPVSPVILKAKRFEADKPNALSTSWLVGEITVRLATALVIAPLELLTTTE